MFTTSIRRLLAVPLVLAATAAVARASEIRDSAGMFSVDGIRRAESSLDNAAVPVVIETIPGLTGRTAEAEALARASREKSARVYVLLTKNDHHFWMVERDARFTPAQGRAIKDAFVSHFRQGDFDGGLVAGSEAITSAVSTWGRRGAAAARGNVPVGARPAPARGGGGFTTILIIGGIVLAVLFGMRILGSLFGAGRGGYGAPGGMRPGMGGPGMGGPGMGYGGGGGGGGFFSSMLGGIGGAMAGNWMYDQFRGRNHGGGYHASDAGSVGGDVVPPDEAGWGGGVGGDWGGGGDVGGGGGDWGGGGGGDWGGGGGGGGGDW